MHPCHSSLSSTRPVGRAEDDLSPEAVLKRAMKNAQRDDEASSAGQQAAGNQAR